MPWRFKVTGNAARLLELREEEEKRTDEREVEGPIQREGRSRGGKGISPWRADLEGLRRQTSLKFGKSAR